MKPAHAHLEKWEIGLIESPTMERFRKFVCVRVQGGRQRE